MNSEGTDSRTDSRVSETYRSLATERPPARLDREVLRMAAREARTPYAAARAWMRPLAWATTIAICLAIAVQLTQLPEGTVEFEAPPEIVPAAGSPPADERAAAEAADALQSQAERPAAPVKERAGEDRRRRDAPAMAGKTAEFTDQPARTDSGAMTKPVAPADGPVDADAGRQAAPIQLRRERATVDAGEKNAATEARLLATGTLDELVPLCPARDRESAARWYECIESLRDSAAEQRLAQEIADFQASYPNYLPETRPGK